MAIETETLKPEVYRALEDIVGAENITQEPGILDTYAYVFGMELRYPNKFGMRPLAVILPGSTEEVQAIVKACNRYEVPFKAHSTGFGVAALQGDGPILSIDMRRMNRILEVNEKGMYGVVEPYVTFASLINASIKKGLRSYIIGAGPLCSALANVTNMNGFGTTNVSAGFGGRTLLGVEWVLPDGEILRTGTLGTSGDWFNGDGPGISLKGIMRGIIGPVGSLGVMTKAAIKLVPWYGPAKIDSHGEPPLYQVVIPESMKVVMVVFPNREAMYEALYLIQEHTISYWCSRRGPFTTVAANTGSNKEVLQVWQTPEFQEKLTKLNYNLTIGLDSSSPREMEYKMNILNTILDKCDGEFLEESPNQVTNRFLHGFNGLGAVKGVFRSSGGMASNPCSEDTLDSVRVAHELGLEIKEKYAEKGLLLNDGDPTWVTLIEDHGGHMETPSRYNPAIEESRKGALEFLEETGQAVIDNHLGISEFEGGLRRGAIVHEEAGPKTMNYQLWMKKIKKAFDPNMVGDSRYYPSEKLNMTINVD
jgi:glycolate oxidase